MQVASGIAKGQTCQTINQLELLYLTTAKYEIDYENKQKYFLEKMVMKFRIIKLDFCDYHTLKSWIIFYDLYFRFQNSII